MAEFESNGELYRSKKLTAFQQFHIARRLTPLLLSFIGKGDVRNMTPEDLMQMMSNFGQALSGMSDADGEYVIGTCMATVDRYSREGKVWTAAWNSAANRAMFSDLYDFAALMPLVVAVIKDNLGNFWSALPTVLSTPEQATQP